MHDFEKLLEELADNKVKIYIDLEGDTYYEMERLFDFLPSFDIIYDVHIVQEGHWSGGGYMVKPEYIVTKDETTISEVEVYISSTDQKMELGEPQLNLVASCIKDLIRCCG